MRKVYSYRFINSAIVINLLLLLVPVIVYGVPHRVQKIPLEVLFGNSGKSYYSTSPDSKYLAYCTPVNGVLNIWVETIRDFRDYGKGVTRSDAKMITHETGREFFDYWWMYDSKHILYRQDKSGDENYHLYCVDIETGDIVDLTPFPDVKVEKIAYRKEFPNEMIIGMNKDDKRRFDAYHLDLVTGELTLLVKNPGNGIACFADANLQVRAAVTVNNDGSQDLLVRDSTNEPWRIAITVEFEDSLKDELYCGVLGFSRDGKQLYLNSSYGTNTRSFMKLDLATKECTILATDTIYDVSDVIFDRDTGEPYSVCWEKERPYRQALDHGNGDWSGYGLEAGGTPWLDDYELAWTESVSFSARDGVSLHGYITYPVGCERRNLPLVLLVHGGPFTRYKWGFNREIQFLANRGYAVLQINYRGSSGYGRDFMALGNGEWARKQHYDLLDSVAWAVDEGIADAKRVAIYGSSHGGYAALVGATFSPDVFCCAVDACGFSNLITYLQTLLPYKFLVQWEKRTGKLEDEELLKSRSPLYHVDQIKIPIFIAHGANDPRVNVAESEQFVEAMKQGGLEYEYMLLSDEGHTFLRQENLLKYYEGVEHFLEKHLGKNSDASKG